MYVHVRTQNELRRNPNRGFVEQDEYKVKVRPKRCKRRMPNFWDDKLRSDYSHRSWKRHRKTQYHILEIKNEEACSYC